jgi:hypothetical protein
MTFLNPLFLFGLAAAAIPLLLHLLNLRKLRTVEFSTLSFLRELQQSKIRRLKLRQLLLLLVRTLLIVFIVLAFARPTLRGTLLGTGLGSQARSSVVLILDDSFSMSASDERGEYLKQAKEAAGELLNVLKDGDEVSLVRLSDLPQSTSQLPTRNLASLRTTIDETATSSMRRPLSDALPVAAQLLQRSLNANKEVYIISDFQQTLLESGGTQQETPQFDERVRFFLVKIGTKDLSNAAVDSVEVVSRILENGKPITIFASVRNFSTVPLKDYVVSVFLNNVRAAQGNVSLEPWGSASIELTVTPKQSGFVRGYVELEPDAIELDNRRYFTFHIPERIRVAMLSSAPADNYYVAKALQSTSQFDVRRITVKEFPVFDLRKVDVLIVSNVAVFTQTDADRIKTFVESGGGVLLAPGSAMQLDNYNSILLPTLDIPRITGIAGNGMEPLGVSFRDVDLDHPLFETIFEARQASQTRTRNRAAIPSPVILQSLTREAGRRGQAIITLSNGSVFLSEHRLGRGIILVQSVAQDLTWSDFPLTGLFAPFVHRSVIYSATHQSQENSFLVGVAPELTIASPLNSPNSNVSSADQSFTVRAPDGIEEILRPDEHSAAPKSLPGLVRKISLRQLRIPGYYDIMRGTTLESVIVANLDTRESDGRKSNPTQLVDFLSSHGINPEIVETIQPQMPLQSAVLQARFGVELWRYCIALALGLALLEMAIARDSRRETGQRA